MEEEFIHLLALSLFPGIGPVTARKMLDACGSATALFKASPAQLEEQHEISATWIQKLRKSADIGTAEKEWNLCLAEGYGWASYQSPHYPHRLLHCADAPLLIFSQGKWPENPQYAIAFVGTRKATDYGVQLCRQLIDGLADCRPHIISGLAQGIDTTAHKMALEMNLPTLAVLGHGFRFLYPSANRALAKKITGQNGTLLTEFLSHQRPDRENFPKRNRIIAGLSDAVVIVEAAHSGGALITARIAAGYNREVFACPGRSIDWASQGCNALIKSQVAIMAENASDLKNTLGWGERTSRAIQPEFFPELSESESALLACWPNQRDWHVEDCIASTELPAAKVAALLFELEMKGVVKRLPGQVYRKILN